MPLTRRALMSTAAAASVVPALPAPVVAQTGVGMAPSQGSQMRSRVSTFLATLEAPQAAAASFAFDDPTRIGWSFMLGSRRAPGLALEQMTPVQKDAALDLLDTALSARGFEKAEQIMLQQDILRDEWGKGSADRNRERFSVMIFGTPSATAPWAWRWEGHHLSLSFTLVGDEIVSVTPSAFSSEPNTVPSGPHAGLVVLTEEEALARALYTDLSDTQRQLAVVNPNSPGNILTTNGRETRYDGDTRGLPLAEMTTSQRDSALRLIEVYTSEPYDGALGAAIAARTAAGIDSTRFIWAGADLSGSIYYRLHSDTFLIEFATLRNQPQHLHAVYQDVERTLGRHVI
ncbi:MAG: DUF3500 domain-containing protein [Pseudomonadota bacterium]